MCDFNDPIFDDDQLAQIEKQKTEQLVSELVDCIISLCRTAAKLRAEVNDLAQTLNPQALSVYYELHSDLCKSFEDLPAYSDFEEQLARLIHE